MPVHPDREFRNPMTTGYARWGVEQIYYASHALHRRQWRRLARMLKLFSTLVFRAYIPPVVAIGERLQLPHGGFGVCIHEDTIVGDDAIIHHNVTIGNGGTRIGNRVYLGSGAVILGAVTIGDDVVIGAGAVVTFDVPSGSYVSAPKGRIFKGAVSSYGPGQEGERKPPDHLDSKGPSTSNGP